MAYLLADRYELTTLIGSGPTGEVWRARERGTREWLAVKLLDPDLSADPHTVDRFQRERHVLTAFLHLAYVRIRHLIAEDGVVALVMELVHGVDLRTWLDRSGPLAPAAAIEIAATLAEALAAAHESGVVHCDLKPSNVMLEDDTGQVRLTDCRVGRLARGFRDGAAQYAYAEYAAPEVARGGPPMPATDVYALGLLLFEMLTGTTPYRLDDPAATLEWHFRSGPLVMADVPPAVRPLLSECLRTEPTIRPSARQVAAELRRMLPGQAAASAPEPPTSAVPRPARTDPAVTFVPERPDHDEPRARPWLGVPSGRPGHGPPPRRRLGGYRKKVPIAVVTGIAALVAGAVLLVTIGMPAAGGRHSPDSGSLTSNGAPPGRRSSGGPGNVPVAPGPGAPQLPASAAPYTLEGATAFVYYWFDTLTYAGGSGNTTPLEAASSPTCGTCATAMQKVRTSYQGGGSLRGGVYLVREARADGFWTVEKPQLYVVFDRSPRSKIGPGGDPVETFPPASFVSCQILLERANDRWRMLDVFAQVPIV